MASLLRPALIVALGSCLAIPCSAHWDEATVDRLTRELKHQEERIVELERQLKSQSLLLQRLEERFGQISPDALALGIGTGTPHEIEPASVRPAASFPVQAAPGQRGEIGKKIEGLLKDLGGFRFSGDFRYRFDLQARSRNSAAGPLQNIRNRYRVRLNIDKEIDPRFPVSPATLDRTFEQRNYERSGLRSHDSQASVFDCRGLRRFPSEFKARIPRGPNGGDFRRQHALLVG